MFRPLLGVGWTLNYEMFFYVLFALAIASRLALIPTLGTVLIALAISSYFHGPSGHAILFYSDSIVLDFLWGMFAAWLFSKKRKSTEWYEAVAVMLIGWVILFTPTPFRPTIGIGAGLIVYGVVLLEPYLQSLPCWMIYLGEASYAIYLVQSLAMPLLPITMARMHVSYVGVAVAGGVFLGVAAGCAAHECLELPIMRYLKSHVEKGARPHIPLEPVMPRKP
jgi:exopolysaccharide production protein ExoZ